VSGQADVEPRVYRAGLAFREGSVEAVVFDLPGCQCVASDREEALNLLPVVIAEHLAWLDQHGDVTRDAFPFQLDVVEEVEVDALTDIADGEFCFDDDRRPTTREEVETALRHMSYARADLLAAVRHLPDLVLDWVPPTGAVEVDRWAPAVRSVRGILDHIAGADGYYVRNVGSAPWAGPAGPQPGGLFEMRERVVQRLRTLSEADLAAEYRKRQPWQAAGFEHWTARKALRRIISHERFHTREIEQRLAWLLIGAPKLARVATGSRA
jgi:hypothetical protein